MRPSHRLLLCAAAAASFVCVAQATPPRAADLPRITNGGTGFIGLTESAGTDWRPGMATERTATRTSGVPVAAGEASTTVNGQPNRDPNDPALRMPSLQAMGASPAPAMERAGTMPPRAPAWWHRSWGTPD